MEILDTRVSVYFKHASPHPVFVSLGLSIGRGETSGAFVPRRFRSTEILERDKSRDLVSRAIPRFLPKHYIIREQPSNQISDDLANQLLTFSVPN